DALVLAAAGLNRLGFGSRIALALPPAACLPAPGQGIVAIEIRHGDERMRSALAAIDDADAATALTAERAVVTALGGGCQTPVGALATVGPDDALEIAGIVVALDGSEAVHGRLKGPRAMAAELGRRPRGGTARGGGELWGWGGRWTAPSPPPAGSGVRARWRPSSAAGSASNCSRTAAPRSS